MELSNEDRAVIADAETVVANRVASVALGTVKRLIAEIDALTVRVEQLEASTHWHRGEDESE